MLPLFGPSSSKAVMWRTWGLRLAFPDRQYLLVWVQEASLSSSSSLFFCQWSDIYKEMRPMFLSQAFETSALRMLLCNWVTVALKEMVMCIRPSLPLAGKKSLHKVLILISTFLFFTFIGRSCQSLLSILSSKPSNIKYDQYVLTYL